MRSEPRWLRRDVVLAIHEGQLAEHGGIAGVRSTDLLESALTRPRTLSAYDRSADLVAVGAMYPIAIARNHPFLDGNKRVAWAAMATFFALNGVTLTFEPMHAVTEMLSLAAGEGSDEAFTAWVRRAAR